jgi:2-polyprenyl-6-methoxyphenol hydroxylase-like FAD-dependent oxidoreductase
MEQGKHIAIIGAGVGGLHLGLLLRARDIDVTIHTDRRPEEHRNIRLLNTTVHHRVTVAREAGLGVDHWPAAEHGYIGHHMYFGGEQPLFFKGDFKTPGRAIDYRIYLPRLMEDFLARGGRIEYGAIASDDIGRIAASADLVVVATGKGPLGQAFQHDAENSPYERPQRMLCVGLYHGVAEEPKPRATLSVSPGHGELINLPVTTFGGRAQGLLFENIPGGDMEVLAHLRYEENPRKFLDTVLEKLERHHPTVYRRVDRAAFDLANGPLDLLQGGVTPTVRKTTVDLGGGKFAIALGDVHATVDPLVAQGSNMASYSAFVLGEAIDHSSVFDQRFCEQVDNQRRDRILCATHWTNRFLQPPTPEVVQLIVAMSGNRALCNEFTDNFNHPDAQWDRIASGARTLEWLKEYGCA